MRIALAAVLAALVVSSTPLSAQRRGAPAGPFAKARGFSCVFPTYAAAAWDGLSARVIPGDDDFRFQITDINMRRGVARFRAGTVAVDVTARLSDTGFNIIEQTPAGNFILTTVFVAGGSADKYVAVHSRHLGDLTTPPSASQYYGTCEVVN